MAGIWWTLGIWFAAGGVAAWLVWWDHGSLCPTPKEILILGMCFLGGPVICVVYGLAWLDGTLRRNKDWWNTPICKRKD